MTIFFYPFIQVERFGYFASKDASNIGENEKVAWLDALDLNDIQIELSSEDESILIENETGNIESNVSFISKESLTMSGTVIELDFPAIQIIGVYDGGIRLNNREFLLVNPTTIELTTARKATLVDGLTSAVTVDYTHLKTDI